MNRKLKAFTLIELLFSLALIGLILSMGSASFRIFLSFYHRYTGQVDYSYEAMIFKDRLSLDMDKASLFEVQKDAGLDVLYIYNEQGISSYSYQFQDSLVLRDNYKSIDSFKLSLELVQLNANSIKVIDKTLALDYSFSLNKAAKARDITFTQTP